MVKAKRIRFGLQGEFRKTQINNDDLTLAELELMAQRIYKLSPSDSIKIRYQDEDNVMVTVGDDTELKLAMEDYEILKLIITLNEDKESAVNDSQVDQQQKQSQSQSQQQLEQKSFENIHEFDPLSQPQHQLSHSGPPSSVSPGHPPSSHSVPPPPPPPQQQMLPQHQLAQHQQLPPPPPQQSGPPTQQLPPPPQQPPPSHNLVSAPNYSPQQMPPPLQMQQPHMHSQLQYQGGPPPGSVPASPPNQQQLQQQAYQPPPPPQYMRHPSFAPPLQPPVHPAGYVQAPWPQDASKTNPYTAKKRYPM